MGGEPVPDLGTLGITDEEPARWQLTRREYECFLERHASAVHRSLQTAA